MTLDELAGQWNAAKDETERLQVLRSFAYEVDQVTHRIQLGTDFVAGLANSMARENAKAA